MEHIASVKSIALDVKFLPNSDVMTSSHVDGTIQLYVFN